MIGRPEQIPVYDAVFGEFFGPPVPSRGAPIAIRVEMEAEQDVGLASPVETLKEKLLALHAGRAGAAHGRHRPCRSPPPYAPPRVVPLGIPDLRRTLRRSFRTGRAARPCVAPPAQSGSRRLILLLDVSGRWTPTRARSSCSRTRRWGPIRRWEAFCFGTRLTRVTRALEGSDPDEALSRAAAQVVDWDGGTRIGESLKRFLDEYGHGGLARGAVVVICSDGLEVGDPESLAEQMARLHRLAHW